MKYFPKIAILAMLLLLTINIYSQSKTPKFGDINLQDFKIDSCSFEENASAIYLFEHGKSEIVYFADDVYVRTEYRARIKILTDDGIDQGNFEYSLFRSSKEGEKITRLKAVTYNQTDNGNVKKTFLEKSQIFEEEVTSNWSTYKFALPKVEKGSVIEVEYTKMSPFLFNFESWEFQAEIPKIKSEFIAIIPANFIYNLRLQGGLRLKSNEAFRLRDHFKMGTGVSDASKIHYNMENIPSYKEERYITTSKNYISMIKYELEMYKTFHGGNINYTKTWKDIEKGLLKDDKFGDQFDVRVLKDEVNSLVASSQNQLELSKSIFDLVKSRMVFNKKYRLYSSKGGLKKALKNGSGNSADINLLLLNALKRANIDADAVALSTRGNGFINRKYPSLSEFNYVIVRVEIDNKTYLLDATRKNVPFGLLPFECYNVRGKVVMKNGGWIDLKTGDRFIESAMVSLTLNKDLTYVADVKVMHGKQSAIRFRNKLDGYNSLNDYVDILEEKNDIIYEDYNVENREIVDKGVIESFRLEDALGGVVKNDRILFNPIIINKFSENPFKLKSRSYPVDYGLPTKLKATYNISIPEGYKLAKKYRPVKLTLPDNMGYYLYSLAEGNNGKLLLRTSFVIDKKVISTSNYEVLKRFYNSVISKNNSMIELKKIDLTAQKD